MIKSHQKGIIPALVIPQMTLVEYLQKIFFHIGRVWVLYHHLHLISLVARRTDGTVLIINSYNNRWSCVMDNKVG